MNAFLKISAAGLGLLLGATCLPAQTFENTTGAAIADGNPSGTLQTIDVSSLTGNILNIQVSLDLAGGYNGDLYVTLAGPNGQTAILLNRVGVTGDDGSGNADPFGFSDAGFQITLDDRGANSGNIHGYALGNYNLNGSGQVIGTWAADGRAIDPQSSPGAFDLAATTANLTLFDGGSANGTWSLYVADLVGGDGAPVLNGWSLNFNMEAVPEPSALALVALAGAGVVWRSRRKPISDL